MWNRTVFADSQAVCLGKLLLLPSFTVAAHCIPHLGKRDPKIAQKNHICTASSQDINHTELLSNEKADDHFRKQILHLQNNLSSPQILPPGFISFAKVQKWHVGRKIRDFLRFSMERQK